MESTSDNDCVTKRMANRGGFLQLSKLQSQSQGYFLFYIIIYVTDEQTNNLTKLKKQNKTKENKNEGKGPLIGLVRSLWKC